MSARERPVITLRTARRLAVRAQGLDRVPKRADASAIHRTVQRIRWLQLDPTSAVAPSHLLVLWSRLGRYDVATLERAIWKEHRLFEHRAFIYPTADLPLYRHGMRTYLHRPTPWTARARTWVAANPALRRHVIDRLRRDGPLPTSAFEDRSVIGWHSSGWTHERNPSQMLEILSGTGRVLVAGRAKGQRLWDLAERVLPATALDTRAETGPLAANAAAEALRALGIATRDQIRDVVTYWMRRDLDATLAALVQAGRISEVEVRGEDGPLPGQWFIRVADLRTARAVDRRWRGRTTLLSPFDNLIRDRARTQALFGMRVVLEIYTPEAKRRWGYFVMPVLRGDALVGRVDPRFDRARGVLEVRALHLEPGVRLDPAFRRDLTAALRDLARFLGGTLRTPLPAPR